jgi:23S rRNA pseudouridine955/2504/2580 synthase
MSFTKVQHLKINEENYDQRIDNFLYILFNKQVARALIYSLIRTGQVRVNSGRIKPGYRLKINDDVRVPPIKLIPEQIINESIRKPNKKFLELWQEKISKAIIFEDQNLLIINKPTKLAVHGGSKVTIGLIEILRNLRPNEHFLELVHRIDQDTSGCLMIAKKRSYLKKLHTLLREQKITKTYSALVWGAFRGKKIIELPLKKIIKSSKEHFVIPSAHGAYAKTEFISEQVFRIPSLGNKSFSLVTAKPTTGKTHQIRVHLTHMGFPIVNDDKYGHREFDSQIKHLRIDRMFLHAKSLKFVCPQTNNIINVTAEYDSDLIKFLSKLEQISG